MSETDVFAALLQLATAGEQQQQQQQPEEPHPQAEAGGEQQVREGEVAEDVDEEDEEEVGEIAEVLDEPPVDQPEERVYLEECPTNKNAPPGNQKRVRTHCPRRSVALPLSLSTLAQALDLIAPMLISRRWQ